MNKKSKLKLKIILALVAGLLSIVIILPFFHELGHYSIACAFNCFAIDKFDYSPTRVLKNLIIPPETGIAHQVTYKGNVWNIFPESQVILIAVGGALYELILFVIVLLLLKNVNERYKHEKKLNLFLLFTFLMGVFAFFFTISVSWLYDSLLILNHYSFDLYMKLAVIIPLYAAIFLFWFFMLAKYMRVFYSHVKGLKKQVK
ncbi:MAG: hypothetical protein NT129_00770 [Candidatus Aenigmarchaeota archaeon]|nr:hypothetical protein [Candidatus Aenigmarchaeota archaeon]